MEVLEYIQKNKKGNIQVTTRIEKNESAYYVKEVLFQKENKDLHFSFFYDDNHRMMAISTEDKSMPFVHRTDWFDSCDGNIYYAIIERDLKKSESLSSILKLAERSGTFVPIYEKYEWQEINHLHPLREDLKNTETYYRMKEHWKKKRFVLKQQNDQTLFTSEYFPYPFDEFLQAQVIQYARRINEKNGQMHESHSFVKRLDKMN